MSDPKPGKVTAADGHVYHKSATANASVAPTNEATLKNANKSKGLTPDELDFVTIVHYCYGLTGELPGPEVLRKDYFYSTTQIEDLFERPQIIQALEERGIIVSPKSLEPVGLPFKADPQVSKHVPKLTPLQLIVANTMLDLTDTRSDRKKLQDLGVTSSKYQSWLRDPDFSGYLRERTEGMIGDVQHEAMLSLIDKVRAGDMKAISYYHELTGRFVSNAGGQGAGSTHDLQQIIIRIIEIIVDEVDDPQVAAKISERLKGLVMGNAVAGTLTEAIVPPPIAAARPMSAEVQNLMDRGAGYNS